MLIRECLIVIVLSLLLAAWGIVFITMEWIMAATFPFFILGIFAFRSPWEEINFGIFYGFDCSVNFTWFCLKLLILAVGMMVAYYQYFA